MSLPRWQLLLIAAALALGAGALAVAAEPYVASPVGEVGTIPVGVPVTFHFIEPGTDAIPDMHVDIAAQVLLDGEVLYATPPAGAHEYDGIHTVTIAFPRTGMYSVEALVDGKVVSNATGVVTQHSELDATADYDIELAQRKAFEATYDIPVPLHAETMLVLSEDRRSALRTSLHSHGEAHAFTYLPVAAGRTTAVHAALQVPEGEPMFPPHRTAFDYAAPPQQASLEHLPTPTLQERNAVTVAEGNGMTLVATFDPYTVVGPETLMRIAVVALDPETGRPLPHTQFDATLQGSRGIEFASSSLHEHDGVWELATRRPVGTYALHVEAVNGEASAQVEAKFQVVPPLEARSVGTQNVELRVPPEGSDVYQVRISGPHGMPIDHAEILVDLVRPDGVPVLSTKAHGHADGTFQWRMAVPPGPHTLRLEPFALEARPVTFAGDLETQLTGPAAAELEPALDPTSGTQALGVAYLSAAVLAVAAIVATLAKRR